MAEDESVGIASEGNTIPDNGYASVSPVGNIGQTMQPLEQAEISTFRDVRFVLTDMDETLTFQGRLAAATYAALENLQAAGVKVIPVTAAPAGWCDQMARMWPVDGVIGENGGFFFRRHDDGHGTDRHFWHDEGERPAISERLAQIGWQVQRAVPSARFAGDQPFRLSSLAFAQPQDPEQRAAILDALRAASADTAFNSLWVLGWFGDTTSCRWRGGCFSNTTVST